MIVTVLLVLLIGVGIYVASHRLSGTQIVLIGTIGLVGLSMVVSPAIASYFAKMLGVGRGTDLVLYFAIIGGLFVTANLYFRSKTIEQRVTLLARSMALAASLPSNINKAPKEDDELSQSTRGSV